MAAVDAQKEASSGKSDQCQSASDSFGSVGVWGETRAVTKRELSEFSGSADSFSVFKSRRPRRKSTVAAAAYEIGR